MADEKEWSPLSQCAMGRPPWANNDAIKIFRKIGDEAYTKIRIFELTPEEVFWDPRSSLGERRIRA